MQQYSQEPANQANIQPAMQRSAVQRENSRLQLSRTYRIVFLIRTQDKVKTIYPSKCYNWIYKADSKIVAHLWMGKRARANEMYNHAKIYCTTRYELKFRVQSAWLFAMYMAK